MGMFSFFKVIVLWHAVQLRNAFTHTEWVCQVFYKTKAKAKKAKTKHGIMLAAIKNKLWEYSHSGAPCLF